MNEEVASEPPRMRPGWVWAIFLYYVVTSAWGLVAYVLIRLNLYPVPTEQQAMLRSLPTSEALVGFLITALSLFAATMLWLLRREAVNLFIAVFILTVCHTVFNVIAGGPLATLLGQGTLMRVMAGFSFVVAWGILLAICVYAWKLRERGLLA